MQITIGDKQGKSARIVRDMLKGDVIQIDGKTYKLGKEAIAVLTNKEESRSFLATLIIIVLGLTVIGLVIAIPVLIVGFGKTAKITVMVKLKDGQVIPGVVSGQEWKILSKYTTTQANASMLFNPTS